MRACEGEAWNAGAAASTWSPHCSSLEGCTCKGRRAQLSKLHVSQLQSLSAQHTACVTACSTVLAAVVGDCNVCYNDDGQAKTAMPRLPTWNGM
jgi:hypothetical protein